MREAKVTTNWEVDCAGAAPRHKSDVQSMLHRFRDSRLRHHEEVRDCAIMKKYVVLLSISPHDGAAEADALG